MKLFHIQTFSSFSLCESRELLFPSTPDHRNNQTGRTAQVRSRSGAFTLSSFGPAVWTGGAFHLQVWWVWGTRILNSNFLMVADNLVFGGVNSSQPAAGEQAAWRLIRTEHPEHTEHTVSSDSLWPHEQDESKQHYEEERGGSVLRRFSDQWESSSLTWGVCLHVWAVHTCCHVNTNTRSHRVTELAEKPWTQQRTPVAKRSLALQPLPPHLMTLPAVTCIYLTAEDTWVTWLTRAEGYWTCCLANRHPRCSNRSTCKRRKASSLDLFVTSSPNWRRLPAERSHHTAQVFLMRRHLSVC